MAKQNQSAPIPSAKPSREGMVRVGSVSNAPWFNLRNGNRMAGKLVNVYERPDERSKTGKSKFFQVELHEATEVRFGRGDDAKVGMAEAGTVVNLNHGPKTRDLEQFIPNILRGAQYDVEVVVNGEKFGIKNKQTMWPIEVFAAQTRGPRADEEPDFDESGAEEEAPAPAAAAS